MTRDLLVTGTDAGVGKTVVSAALARLGRAVYVKPVQPGAADGDDDAADVAALADVETVTGPVLGPSLDPGIAARMAGAELLGSELAEVVREARSQHPGRPLVVEGVGGLLTELGSEGTTSADLAAELALPVLVVTSPGPGALNHTALTLAVLRDRGLDLAGVVVCGAPANDDDGTRTILAELDRLSGGRLAGVVPQLSTLEPAALDDAASWFTDELGGTAERSRWT